MPDMSLISGLAGGLSQAVDLVRGALQLRDAQLLGAELAKLNHVLLDAQQRLFSLGAELLALQEQHFKAREELREMRETLAERSRYTLVEIGQGQMAYRSNDAPVLGAAIEPVLAQPQHYLCQQCWDIRGAKSILVLHLDAADGPVAICRNCRDGWMRADLIAR